METYYKAVRLNGRDFRTDTVDYAGVCGRGETLPELPGGECCGPGVYHASTVAAETLVGGEWPCRLFEVEGEPVSFEGYKRGFKTLTVVREIDAHLALGPNGRAVAALIARAGRLTEYEEMSLAAAWNATRDATRDAAWNAAWYAAWYATRGATRDAARYAAWNAAWYAAWNAARGAARDAACGTAMALVIKDLIPQEQFDTLYGPWASVIDTEPNGR